MIISMREKFGTSFGIRNQARNFRNEIEEILLDPKEKIIFDMENVNVISSSFADELVAKLYLQPKFHERIKIINSNDDVQIVILVSLKKRREMNNIN